MRFVALALIALSLPLLMAYISGNKARRDILLVALGALLLAAGGLNIEPSIISWPMWPGTVRGMMISPVDTIALALILTRRGGFDRLPFRLLIALYAVPILLSLTTSTMPMAGTFTIFQLGRMMLLFVAVAGEMTRPSALRSLMMGLSLGLLLQAGFVVQQKLTGVVQATGAGVHQNTLGMMVELSMIVLIAAVLEGERNKLIYGGVLGGLIVIAGGGSRGTMAFAAGAIILLVLLSLARRSTPRKWQVLGLGVLAAAIVVPLGYFTLKERFGEVSVLTEEEQRAAFARAATAMAADHPLGVGANNYVTVANVEGYSARAGVAWNEGNRQAPVHNAYLLARAETGWAGQIMLMFLLCVPVLMALRLAFRHRKSAREGIVLGSAASIMAIIAHNNFEFAWHNQQSQALFFMNLAIIAGSARALKIERAQRRREARAAAEAARKEPTEPQFGSPQPVA